jgi:ABC-type tungstate transport system permease subunit
MTTSILSFCWLRPRNAHTITDRATWANFKNRQDLEILAKGDPACSTPTAASWSTPPSGHM